MTASPRKIFGPVLEFLGENRSTNELFLKPSVSPDAQNADYSRLTLAKRQGFRKLHTNPALSGAIYFVNSASAKCIQIKNLANYFFAGPFTIEFIISVGSSVGNPEVLTCKDSSTNSGWEIYVDNTNRRFVMTWYDGTGTERTIASANESFWWGRSCRVAFRRNESNVFDVWVAGTTTAGGSYAGATSNGRPLYVAAAAGSTPGNTTGVIVVDDIRFWSDYRTDAELIATESRALNSEELQDPNLVGYWPLDEISQGFFEDLSLNKNHGVFYNADPGSVSGLVPSAGTDNFAIRFDGMDQSAYTSYHSDYAPILNTGPNWCVQLWIRFDHKNFSNVTVAHLGGTTTGKGSPFWIYATASGGVISLKYKFSTTTTHSNEVVDPGYTPVVGVPFHLTLHKRGTIIRTYINGELWHTKSGIASGENGPTTSTSYGMYFGAEFQNGSAQPGTHAPVTIDEVRLFNTAPAEIWIDRWWDRECPVVHENLCGYWRFNAPDRARDETGNSDVVIAAAGDLPQRAPGYAYPREPQRMLLCAPFTQPVANDPVRPGLSPFRKELIVATATDYWSLSGTKMSYLATMARTGDPSPFSWCHFQNKLILCNGVEENRQYDGRNDIRNLSLDAPTAACTATPQSGGGWQGTNGTYYYKYAYRNSFDGTESLASPPASATMSTSHSSCLLTGFILSTDPQVDKIRIYRLDPNASSYRYLADINNSGTPSYSDNGSDISGNALLNDNRGKAERFRYCAVYANRIWGLNTESYSSGLIYSEADSESDWPAANLIFVNEGDGDEGTGLVAAFGGLIIFKQYSIHFMTGDSANTFSIRKVVVNQGCVAGQTIQWTPEGVYFLGNDGVYLMDSSFNLVPVGASQRDLFEKMDPETLRYAAATYDPVRRLYLVSLDIAQEGSGSYYDEFPGFFTNYWPLKNSGADNKNLDNLTAYGSPIYSYDSSRFETVHLDGSNDYFEKNSFSQIPTSSYSFGCWFKLDAWKATPETIAELRYDASHTQFKIFLSGGLRFWSYNSSGTSYIAVYVPAHVFQANEWHHIVCTRNASGIARIYVDGRLQGIEVSGMPIYTMPSAAMHIGAEWDEFNPGQFTSFFEGFIQNAFYVKDRALDEKEIERIYQTEILEGYKTKSRITLVYDEATKSWAQWDVGFDALVATEYTKNRAELLGVRRGFVCRLFDGEADGSHTAKAQAFPLVGGLTAASGTSITDASAEFPTENAGLAGCDVIAYNAADGRKQRRTILSNTETVLYLDSPIYPEVTGTYCVAPIDWYWESPWMQIGEPGWRAVLRVIQIWQVEQDVPATVAVKYKTEYQENWSSATFTNEDEFNRLVVATRGRRFKIRFEQLGPHRPVELLGFAAEYEQMAEV